MSATPTNPPSSDVDLDALIQSLPACKRCRDCRRGCDTLLPKCRQCTKAGVECIFYDHGRNEYLPRSYIAELVDHVRSITSRSADHPSPAMSGRASQDPNATAVVKAESVASDHQHYDHHFAYAGHSYRYLGAESCLVKSPRLQSATVQSPPIEDDDEYHLVFRQSRAKKYELVEAYLDAVQPLYPILDPSLRFLAPEVPSDLTEAETFALNMIYSIACHVFPGTARKKNPELTWNPSGRLSYHQGNVFKYRGFAETYFNLAMEHLEASTVEPTITTLRAVLLLAINSFFDPKSGNIGQQVALATRLALNLEAKLDVQELAPEDAQMMRNMHSTIFSIENEIASTLDRPATFPEPDWPLSFDRHRPADYLCSLYRLQHRHRKGDPSIKNLLPPLDERGELVPGLRMALHQTHLLVNPCWGSAWYVLEAVVSSGSIHVFLTPHWVYRAGCVMIQNMSIMAGENLIQLYSNALVVLELSSGKWPSSAELSASLTELMQHMKMKFRPHWENTLTQGDVRI